MKDTFYNIDGRNEPRQIIATYSTSDLYYLDTFGTQVLTIPNLDGNSVGDIISDSASARTYVQMTIGQNVYNVTGGSANFQYPDRTVIVPQTLGGGSVRQEEMEAELNNSVFCEFTAVPDRVPQGFTPIDTSGTGQIDDGTPPDYQGTLINLATAWFDSNNKDCRITSITNIVPDATTPAPMPFDGNTGRDLSSLTSASEFLSSLGYIPQTIMLQTGTTWLDTCAIMVSIVQNFDDCATDLPYIDTLAEEFFIHINQDCEKRRDDLAVAAWITTTYTAFNNLPDSDQQSIVTQIVTIIDTDPRFCGDEIIGDPPMPTIEEIAQEYYFSPTGLDGNCDNIPTNQGMGSEVYAGQTATWLAANYPQLFPNESYSVGDNTDGMFDTVIAVQNYITQNYCPNQDQPDVEGCTQPSAANFNPYATIDDGSCINNYDLNTNPNGVANDANAELLGSLAVLDADYGDLIEDTIQLINELQVALDQAIANEGVPDSEVQLLEQQLADAQTRLSDILGADGMISLITNAVVLAENGNYNANIYTDILQSGTFAYLQEENPEAYQNLLELNTALNNINGFANSNATLTAQNAELNESLLALQNQLDNITPEDGVSQEDVDAVQNQFDLFLDNLASFLGVAQGGNLDYTFQENGLPEGSIGNVNELATTYNQLLASYNNLESLYEELQDTSGAIVEEDGISQADVDAAIAAATSEALSALNEAGVNTASFSQADLTTALSLYIAQYIQDNDLVTATDNMLTDDQLATTISNAIREYVNNFINDTLDGSNATATANLQEYIDGLVADAIAAAFAEGAASVTPEDGVSQADVDAAVAAIQAELQSQIAALEAQLAAANAEIDSLSTGAINNNTISNQTLQEAYATIDQLIDDADAQFQIYANDIAAYEQFLDGLGATMNNLENFLQTNYGYDPDSADKFTIPTNTPIAADAGFNGRGSMPISEIYLNFAGRAVNLSRGFKRFGGQPMRRNMLNANGTEASFELNPKAKNIVAITGVVLASFGIYTLLKKK